MSEGHQHKDSIDIYLEKEKARLFVGRLSREKGRFVFLYDDAYRNRMDAMALGPDIPLNKKRHTAKRLFPTFEDRIPSRENPAWGEYCQWTGIDEKEDDPMVLLLALGRRGPTSFMLEPTFRREFSWEDAKAFRKKLNLSVREFAAVFDFSPATVYRLEHKKTTGKDALKRIELYARFPEAALFEVQRRGGKINDNRKKALEDILKDSLET